MVQKENLRMVIVAALVFCMMMPNKVKAAEGGSKTVQILETVYIEENAPQMGRMGLPQASIGSGKTISFLDNNASMFYVAGGTTVSFSIKLNASASVQMGYINNSNIKTKTYSGTGSSHSTSFTIPNTGYYRFYVTNQSSNTVQVTGGTISF